MNDHNIMKLKGINKPVMLDQMTGLFMPFFADNNWLKGCDKIEMDLNCMYPFIRFNRLYFFDKIKSIHSLFSFTR